MCLIIITTTGYIIIECIYCVYIIQVSRLAGLVKQVCQDTKCDSVIDVGSGLVSTIIIVYVTNQPCY